MSHTSAPNTLDIVEFFTDTDNRPDKTSFQHLIRLRKDWNKEQALIRRKRERIEEFAMRIPNATHDDKMYFIELYTMLFVDFFADQIQKKIDRVDRILSLLGSTDTLKKGQLTIERAKLVPISGFVDFNRAGFACCIWHNENTPSMKYYPQSNRVKCYGCDKSGDVLDVVMQIRSCDLKEALRLLAP